MRLWRRPRQRGPSEATRAREQAELDLAQTERDLEQTRAETQKYRALARSLIEIQQVNHLGQNAARVLRGEKR